MARQYYQDFDYTIAEGDSFDSHTARISGVDNLEALYECNELDLSIVYTRAMVCATAGVADEAEGINSRLFVGPFIIPARKDRDGLYRSLKISPLVAGGTNTHSLRCFCMRQMEIPSTNNSTYCSFSVPSGTVLDYETAGTITPGRDMTPMYFSFPRDTPEGQERGDIDFWWLIFEWLTFNGASGPLFGGLRVRENIIS